MSTEVEREDSSLLEAVTQQLTLYDNLFPQVDNKELQVLFALTRIYLARCDNPQLKQEHIMINPQLMKKLTLTYFNPFTTPTKRSLRDALVSRLNSIRKYRITNPEVVRRALVTCLYQEEKKVNKKQRMYLDAFMRNPDKPFKEIAKQLGVTPQAVSLAYRSLQESSLFKFWGYINYPAFKLRHFVVFFTPMTEYRENAEYLKKLLFDNLPFALSLNVDIYEGNSWASLVIPNQEKELHEFKSSLNELRGEVFRDLSICELKSFSTGSNLEFFDGKHWFFDPQLWTYGFFEFVRENKEILRKAHELNYSKEPMKFDRADLLIALILATNPLISHRDIEKELRKLGYDLSRPTITRRVRMLMPRNRQSDNRDAEIQPAVYPYMSYSGWGLNNLSLYLIECEEKYVEEMCYAVAYLPYYFLYRTDRGVLLSIKSTSEDVAKINYMIKGISEIKVVTHSNRFESMGIRVLNVLSDKWDETRQKWVCASGELNIVKRFESLP